MREIYLDLTEDKESACGGFLGFEGEHLETRLTVKLPPRMLCEEGASYRFLFETAGGEAVTSAALQPVEGALSLLLPASLLRAPRLTVQAACYGDESEERFIAKSGRILLQVAKSVSEDGAPFQSGVTPVPGLTVDSALSAESQNPVENRAITAALKAKLGAGDLRPAGSGIRDEEHASDALVPTERAVAAALAILEEETEAAFDNLEERLPISEEEPDAESRNPLTNGASCTLFAPAVKGRAVGNPVLLTDVSPLPHAVSVNSDAGETAVTVYGKNLLPWDKPSTVTKNGVTIERKEDGSIVLNGTAEKGFGHNIAYQVCKELPVGTVLTVSSEGTGAQSWSTYVLNGTLNKSDGTTIAFACTSTKGAKITIPEGYIGMTVHISIYPGAGEMKNVTFRPMIELGDTATAYEPYQAPVSLAAGEAPVARGMSMTLFAPAGTVLTAEYNKDVGKLLSKLAKAVGMTV